MPNNARKAAEMAAREVISALGDPVKHEAAVANIATFFESYAAALQASATRPVADPDGQSEAVLREALDKLTWTYMPTYGELPWQALKEAIAEATVGYRHHDSARWSDEFYIGHQMAGINMNSLNRIVSAFVRAALTSPARARGEG